MCATFVVRNIHDRIVRRHLDVAHGNLVEWNAVEEFGRRFRIRKDVHFSGYENNIFI